MYLDADREEEGELPDEVILARSVREPALFAVLVDRYQEAFMRKARKIVRGEEEAEDVVQETFTKIYVYAARYTPQEGARFSSWAYMILVNTACSHYKKLKRERGVRAEIDPEILELMPDLRENLLAEADLKDAVSSTLARMPHLLARTLERHFLDDRPQKEVADEDGVSVAVVKTRVLRAKQAFKKVSEIFNTV